MAGTYGSRDKNRFIIPSTYKINGKTVQSDSGNVQYYLLVNTNGDITVKSPTVAGNVDVNVPFVGPIGGANADRTIGTIPKDGTFKYEPGSATMGEIQYFQSAVGQTAVKNQAVLTAQKAGVQNAQQLIFPNTALGSPQKPSESGSAKPTDTQTGTNPTSPAGSESSSISIPNEESKAISDIKVIPNGEIVKYPIKIKDDQDKIKFQAYTLNPRTLTPSKELKYSLEERTNAVTQVGGSVYLAIQSSITDQNGVNWGPDNVSAIDMAIFNKSYEGITPNSEIGNYLSGMLNEVVGAARNNQEIIKRAIAGYAANLNNIVTRTDNVILNPNMELLFNSPTLRPFNFSFKLSPREEKESVAVKQIIKYFKAHMAVRKDANSLFLRSPNVFKIEYLYGNKKEHKGLNLIKLCALTNCSVDYTPLGSYMTYNEGTMVSYTLNLQFQELVPIYQDDYTEEGHPIGY